MELDDSGFIHSFIYLRPNVLELRGYEIVEVVSDWLAVCEGGFLCLVAGFVNISHLGLPYQGIVFGDLEDLVFHFC